MAQTADPTPVVESQYSRALRPGTRKAMHATRDDIRLLSPDLYADPHERFRWMRANAPVYWDDSTGIWGIARYEDLMVVARDWETFCSGEGSRPDSSARRTSESAGIQRMQPLREGSCFSPRHRDAARR